MNQLSNYQRVSRRIQAAIDTDQFWARYPKLAEFRSALEGTGAIVPDARQLFNAIRNDLPAAPDVVDRFLMQAARLDLQQREGPRDYSYLDETSDQGKAVRDAIGARMNLPFVAANYLCHLSNRYKCLYVATPKVGCTTIKRSLQEAEMDGTLVFRRYGEEHSPTLSPLLAPLDDPALYFSALERADWFRFTFVRNPFSRVLSCYLDKIVATTERRRLLPELGFELAAGVPTFRDFLKAIAHQPEDQRDFHWAPQSWLTQPRTMHYHFVGRMERFEADFQHVCETLGISASTSAVKHSTNAAAKLAQFYGAEEIELVQAIYADDFADFGYHDRQLPGA